ncbi:MAG: hypothetical protein ACLUSL_12525 [Ruminococcus sp.]
MYKAHLSDGHIVECFYRKPLIPKSVLMQRHQEGLIFGQRSARAGWS